MGTSASYLIGYSLAIFLLEIPNHLSLTTDGRSRGIQRGGGVYNRVFELNNNREVYK
jgi:hypothetical protein